MGLAGRLNVPLHACPIASSLAPPSPRVGCWLAQAACELSSVHSSHAAVHATNPSPRFQHTGRPFT